jgi:ABC-type transport system involved in cytochrome bd biosynthesis fused ATPase/permease subunit
MAISSFRRRAFVPRSTILIASHRRVALDFCDRVVMLEQGRIVRNDAPDYTAGVQRDYGLVL